MVDCPLHFNWPQRPLINSDTGGDSWTNGGSGYNPGGDVIYGGSGYNPGTRSEKMDKAYVDIMTGEILSSFQVGTMVLQQEERKWGKVGEGLLGCSAGSNKL